MFKSNLSISLNPERFENAKKLIDDIVLEARRLNRTKNNLFNVAVNAEANPFPGPHVPYPIPNSLIGLIIGKNGETIK